MCEHHHPHFEHRLMIFLEKYYTYHQTAKNDLFDTAIAEQRLGKRLFGSAQTIKVAALVKFLWRDCAASHKLKGLLLKMAPSAAAIGAVLASDLVTACLVLRVVDVESLEWEG